MEFQVLGRVGYRAGESWVRPRGALRRRMLGVLLARAGHVVTYDALAQALWPGQDDDPQPQVRVAARLHLHAHRFRQELDSAERLVADGSGYLLQVEHDELDATRFARLVEGAMGAAADDPARAGLAREALSQWADPWGGTAYPDLDVPLVTDEAQRLEQLRLDVTDILFDAEIRLGHHQEVLADLERVAAAHPLREPLQVRLMQGLHQAGRPVDALDVYARTRRVLVDELGMEPSEPLRRMQEFVLSGQAPQTPAPGRERVTVQPMQAPPAQLPASVPLVGRDGALELLDAALTDGTNRHALISGLPGVGKTALAVAWVAAHRADFPDGQLYVDFQGYGPTPGPSVDAALERFIRALGGDPAGARDREERVATYRSLLAGRQVAILIDNARSEEAVRPLLPGDNGCASLVTSRDDLTGLIARDNVHHVPLQPLDREHAVALLRSLAGAPETEQDDSSTEPAPAAGASRASGTGLDADQLERLAERCGGLPIALRVAALRARDADVLDGGPGQGAPDVLDLLDVGDPMTSARTIFSWSVDALDRDDLRLFLALGVNVASRIDVGGLAALIDTDPRTARRGVERLVRANLAQLEAGWVRQHDLLAAYSAERGSSLARAEREQMLRRLLGYYVDQVKAVDALTASTAGQSVFRSLQEANQWLDRAAAPLVTVAEMAADFAGSEVTELSRYLGGALTGRGALELAGRLHSTAVMAAERRGDLEAAALAMQVLAAVTGKLGDQHKADQQWARAREMAIASGSSFALAVVHNNYTSALLPQGQFPRAWGHLRAALRHIEVAGDQDRSQSIRANMGFVLVILERHEHAERVLRELLGEAVHPSARSNALRSLAILQLRRARPRAAEPLIREAIDLTTQTSEHILRSEFGALQAEARFGLGDHETARELLEASLAELAHQGEQAELVLCLIGLARLDRDEHPRRSMVRLDEALARTRRHGLLEMEFRVLLAFGELYDIMGQEVRAIAVRDMAGSIRLACGLPKEPAYAIW
ncbi:hypothetical protein NF556_14760 [Ornithinimicrobium faecis]|uniref:Bacterial transcriptional activator domain-containing protein n=1 Tax=Ornithinimicrobium faecis TaxID=2934158 RepID=A0ABY4YQ38_9MICO|nr:BTAD domain-containing putative transcriptional regulator [Ornithinimicrobium sp. HY1793]USQ78879.1 hypothetical protein NF556_14760 [Ornithinimicrobium sp. HY1793]